MKQEKAIENSNKSFRIYFLLISHLTVVLASLEKTEKGISFKGFTPSLQSL